MKVNHTTHTIPYRNTIHRPVKAVEVIYIISLEEVLAALVDSMERREERRGIYACIYSKSYSTCTYRLCACIM